MNKQLNIQDFSIVVVAQNNNPTILNPDFLKFNQIVPADWELKTPPMCIEPMAAVHFKTNNIKITAQLDKIIFLESVGGKNTNEILLPEIVHKYTNTLPHVEYTAIGLNPRGHIALDGSSDSCQKYLSEQFLAPGEWQNIGDSPIKSTLKFAYKFGDIICNLTVEEKPFKLLEEEATTNVITFAANFHHELVGSNRKERLEHLHRLIKDWEDDCNLYKDLVSKITA